jgi:hypothetical protein
MGNGKARDPRKLVEVVLTCSVCGTPFPIRRLRERMRESGHIKHLWCCICKDRTAHKEPERGEVTTYADRRGLEEAPCQRID